MYLYIHPNLELSRTPVAVPDCSTAVGRPGLGCATWAHRVPGLRFDNTR